MESEYRKAAEEEESGTNEDDTIEAMLDSLAGPSETEIRKDSWNLTNKYMHAYWVLPSWKWARNTGLENWLCNYEQSTLGVDRVTPRNEEESDESLSGTVNGTGKTCIDVDENDSVTFERPTGRKKAKLLEKEGKGATFAAILEHMHALKQEESKGEREFRTKLELARLESEDRRHRENLEYQDKRHREQLEYEAKRLEYEANKKLEYEAKRLEY